MATATWCGALPASGGEHVRVDFDSIGRGVIDLRDVVYFLSLAGIFLALAYAALLGRKLAPAGAAHRRLQLGVGLLAASLVVVTVSVDVPLPLTDVALSTPDAPYWNPVAVRLTTPLKPFSAETDTV